MSFEEEFPSLMEKVETVVESRMGTKLPLSYHKYEVDEDSGEKMFMMEYIRESCVDKAKLREAIEKICFDRDDNIVDAPFLDGMYTAGEQLFEELGL